MLVGYLGFLIVASGFITEVPPLLAAKLSATNEVSGTFVQTKVTPPTERMSGRRYVSRGMYRIRPGIDFTWKTLTPFESTFYATPTNYVYSNEDELVTHPLKDLPGCERIVDAIPRLPSANLDFRPFFDTFDALYKEENGRFFVKAKPKVGDLKRAIARVEAEGMVTNWTLFVTFPNKVQFKIEFKDE